MDEKADAQRQSRPRLHLLTASLRGYKLRWRRYFGHYGLLSVHGSLFYHGFYVRQLVEFLLQTYQAYHISRSVPRVWINRFVVAMIIINCIYAPLVNVVLKLHPAWRRVMNLLIDVLIDFAIAVIVPLCVFLPRVYQMNWPTPEYPPELIYNDVWLAGALSEGRQIMVTSVIDYISSMSPHFIGFMDIRTIERLLQRAPVITSRSGNTRSQVTPDVSKSHPPSPPIPSLPPALARLSFSLNREERVKIRRAQSAFTIVTAVWAIGVLVLHCKAGGMQSGKEVGCELFSGAWWVSKPACSIVHLNCHRLNVQGEEEEMATPLAAFDPLLITKVTFSHCSALNVPAHVTKLQNLQNFEIFNCTIAAWHTSAAFSQANHPLLSRVNVIDTNLTSLPGGILHSSLPSNMVLRFYRGNLSVLPEDIGHVWAAHRWSFLYFEYTQLRALPVSFGALQLHRLSLEYNQLDHIDDELLKNQRLYRVRLSGNPMSSLPASIGSTSILQRVALEHTNISSIPAWLRDWWATVTETQRAGVAFSLFGSPICELESHRNAPFCQPIPVARRDAFPYDVIANQRPY
ncbi:hypothetical protein PINS_up013901 [Pythium insidiosum]|nr:hypothetical protein PINS_up013901 [Pythium insidiosum]